ncbi:DUF3626 domain-containing protein [Salininema proteolyticum]|uniref:DUF3626 domain-containing protein n=1 Tax=Salininema proteolyticum TaxID=1607685 RepID=A0ABV8U1D9_9ACTN
MGDRRSFPPPRELSESQRLAVEFVRRRAFGPALDRAHRITVNFHPDRAAGGRPILDSFKDQGVYLSQFATGTGNGGMTAFPGGDRWTWEGRIFGGAYDTSAPHERPVYGALNHRALPFGASPRFGSSHLRLKPTVLPHSTFCFPDSAGAPRHFGVAEANGLPAMSDASRRDHLDNYVEAQVHGGIRFDRDVETVVLDPSFRGTAVEDGARKLSLPVEFHPGFTLDAEDVPLCAGYRGEEIANVAAALLNDGALTAREIGTAAREGTYDHSRLKKVWHCVARFGYPWHEMNSG